MQHKLLFNDAPPTLTEPRNQSAQDAMMYCLYLPLNGNDGYPSPLLAFAFARDQITRFAGGYTLLPPSDGLWVGPRADVYQDRVLPILVVARAGQTSEQFFAALALQLANMFGQETIFIHATPVRVVEVGRSTVQTVAGEGSLAA
jgi:hypothetical protein